MSSLPRQRRAPPHQAAAPRAWRLARAAASVAHSALCPPCFQLATWQAFEQKRTDLHAEQARRCSAASPQWSHLGCLKLGAFSMTVVQRPGGGQIAGRRAERGEQVAGQEGRAR